MPVLLERRRAGPDAPMPGFERRARMILEDGGCLDIALVNNMPDAARESTERQFVDLLSAASTGCCVRLKVYSFQDVQMLRAELPDGLIVTGTEPHAPSLQDEPYWETLVGLLEWANGNAIPSIWSCLAAHAAVLHLDGIERVPLAHKRFGLFECVRSAEHSLMAGVPYSTRVVHSRWNELPLDALVRSGYTVLTRSVEAGVDTFLKQRNSLMLLFQGHPEYDTRALLREYRRDIGRYLRGERETYPETPRNYVDQQTVVEFAAFKVRAVANRYEGLLAEFPITSAEAGLTPNCDSPGARIYENWLAYLFVQKAKRAGCAALSWRNERQAAALTTEDVG